MRWMIEIHDPFTGSWTPYTNRYGEIVTLSCEAMAIVKARALERVYRGVLYRAALAVEAVA
jgi:hypothetical protein